jgi:hypothetical protein
MGHCVDIDKKSLVTPIVNEGYLLVVADLHGNKSDFDRVIDQYHKLKNRYGQVTLLFLGDLIHCYNYKTDQSLQIVDQLIEMGANHPNSHVICMLGNHELVHIYHWSLYRGRYNLSQGFEWKIKARRSQMIQFFESMPIATFASAGLLFHHTGASPVYNPVYLNSKQVPQQFWHSFSHSNIKRHIDNFRGDQVLETSFGNQFIEVFI